MDPDSPTSPSSLFTLELKSEDYYIAKSDKAVEGIFASIRVSGVYTIIYDKLPSSSMIRDKIGPWKMFSIQGTLGFELVGVIASISRILAESDIP